MSDETKLTDAERGALMVAADQAETCECCGGDYGWRHVCAAVERILAERTQALRDEVERLKSTMRRSSQMSRLWDAEERTEQAEGQLAKVRELANAWDEIPDYQPSVYDKGRCDQRHMMVTELLLALGSES